MRFIKQNRIITLISILMILALAGFGTNVFAESKQGKDVQGCPYSGKVKQEKDAHQGCPYSGGVKQDEASQKCPAYTGNLNAEQIKKLDAERQAFHSVTKDIEQKLSAKGMAMKSEFAKPEPDAETVKSLQREISDIEAQMDLHRVDHFLRIKKINPDFSGISEAGCQVSLHQSRDSGGDGCSRAWWHSKYGRCDFDGQKLGRHDRCVFLFTPASARQNLFAQTLSADRKLPQTTDPGLKQNLPEIFRSADSGGGFLL